VSRFETANNLDALADYIDKNVPQSRLYMPTYRSDDEKESVGFRNIHDCGTCGCAQGWSPFVFPPVEFDYAPNNNFIFTYHGIRVFPALYNSLGRAGVPNEHWRHIFSHTLSSDKAGVLARIRSKAEEFRTHG